MSEAVRGMLAEETARIQSRGLRLSADIAPDVTVEGDRAKISQLVSILLDNAIKYADEGGCIDIKLTKSARYAEYRVKNSGPGIAAEDLPMIFERFYRANRAREHEDGSFGLGLSVAKMIAEQFGGRITAESVPGEATSFAVVLPLRAEGRARRVRKIDNA
jgi:signal transduction histidine kinase